MKNKKNYWIVVLLITSFLIRIINLNQSIWLDEATTAKVVKSFPFFQIITKFSPTDFHPPLYYLFMKLWTNLFGYSEIALRLPSVIFSVFTGYIIYLIVKRIKDEKTGLWAAAFFLFSPLIIYYSQEARMYSLATLFLTLAVFFYYQFLADSAGDFLPANARSAKKIAESPRCRDPLNLCHLSKNNFLYIFFITLSFYTFYGSVFLIAAFFIYFLFKKQYRFFVISALIFLIFVIIILPLLLRQLSNSRSALSLMPNWKQVLGPASIKNLALIFIKFSFGRISFYPKKIYYFVSGIWTAVIFLFVFKGAVKNKFLGLLFFLPIFLGLIFSFWSPLLQYFRFLYLIPILSILLIFGLSIRRKFHLVGGFLVIGGYIILSIVYLMNPSFHREDWKSLVRDLNSEEKIYMIQSSSDPVLYYNKNIIVNDLKKLGKTEDKKIIVIPYTSDIHGVNYQKNLKEQNFSLVSKKSYRELVLEYWSQ